MDIGYVWDETKYKKVLNEHNVKFSEVVAAFEDPDGFDVPSPVEHENRWRWLVRLNTSRTFIDDRLYRSGFAVTAHHYCV
jgi:uncharacterized DUF497 family protein